MSGCDASALLGHPERTPGVSLMVAYCAKGGHDDAEHRGRLVMDGEPTVTSITRYENDRRTFRGDLTLCDESTCILPAGHRGRHAE